MRFAYIDSQGKEVAIPSVEALQLRIELGAIVPSTMFFDAGSDRWAPAGEHEIFRSLQRAKAESEDPLFAAPPMDAGQVVEPGLLDADSLFVGAVDLVATDGGLDPSLMLERPVLPPAPIPPAGAEVGGFTLASLEEPPPQEPGPADIPWDPALEISAADDGLGIGSFEIQSNTFSERDLKPPAPAAESGTHRAGPRTPSGAMEDSGASPTTAGAAPDGPPGWADEDAGVGSGGQPAKRSGRSPTAAEPRHQVSFVPDAAPVETVAVKTVKLKAEAVEEAFRARTPPQPAQPKAPETRPEPRARAQAPRPAVSAPTSRRSSPAGLVAGIVLLAVVFGGGWFGWSMMSGEEPPPVARTYAPVELLPIPAEYEPVFRQLAAGALLDVVERMTALESVALLPPSPPMDWLGSQYLADASNYPEVATYWNQLNAHLMSLRAQEEEIFRQAFEGRLSLAAVATPAHDELIARSVAGYRAALPERDRSYDRLAAVLGAAIGLHEFLIRNEDRIDYRPVPGGTVLEETRPASEELGDEMWRKVDAITDALEALGALGEQVTTRRLFALTLDGVASATVH
jgi:hypothetical protein